MHAHVGDKITTESHQSTDAGRRHGTVVAVLDEGGEEEHYRVRWQDGHESIFFPGPDAHLDEQRA
ncbi:MAG: DUF1918 domain-containing protein [Actinomycetota bacterium]|nr:DUF1918 domain-containing protein [Actinomycetota bacterium]